MRDATSGCSKDPADWIDMSASGRRGDVGGGVGGVEMGIVREGEEGYGRS